MKEKRKTDDGSELTLIPGGIKYVLPSGPGTGGNPSGASLSRIVFPRLLIGLVVLICAEVFSGASIQAGLWHPWTWLVTYWLYFAHFFFFTTLAVRTGRTSFWSLYLWGVLFGLYESWITKVIWYGYSGDGKFVMGSIGPYGFSEISMVFLFHPVASFILPLAVVCVLCPTLRRLFPDLAWFTGKSRGARVVQVYLVVSFATVMAMNSGGPVNLAMNLAVVIVLLFLLLRLSRSTLSSSDGHSIVVFSQWGFVGLCLYLVLLYVVTYVFLRPEGLPTIPVQLVTFVFYALAIAGLWLHRRREPLLGSVVEVKQRESKLVITLFAIQLGLGLALSVFAGGSVLFFPVILSFVIWTPLGFLLAAVAIVKGFRERVIITCLFFIIACAAFLPVQESGQDEIALVRNRRSNLLLGLWPPRNDVDPGIEVLLTNVKRTS